MAITPNDLRNVHQATEAQLEDYFANDEITVSGTTFDYSEKDLHMTEHSADIIEANTLASFPTVGASGKFYLAKQTKKVYFWSGSAYQLVTQDITTNTSMTDISSTISGLVLAEEETKNLTNYLKILGVYLNDRNLNVPLTYSKAVAGDDISALSEDMAFYLFFHDLDSVVFSMIYCAAGIYKVTGDTFATATVTDMSPRSVTATATDIKMNGAQAVGSLETLARADHVHPIDTSKEDSIGSKGTAFNKNFETTATNIKASNVKEGNGSVGDSGIIANSNHIHPLPANSALCVDLTAGGACNVVYETPKSISDFDDAFDIETDNRYMQTAVYNFLVVASSSVYCFITINIYALINYQLMTNASAYNHTFKGEEADCNIILKKGTNTWDWTFEPVTNGTTIRNISRIR